MPYGRYLRADKYLYQVADRPFDLHMFLHFVHPPFLELFGNSNQFVQLKFYFVQIIGASVSEPHTCE